jgi:hypothetical protein
MVKYYWYVSVDPAKYSGLMPIDNYISRDTSVPPIKYSYVTETVDGKNHTIAGKSGIKLISANDGGNLIRINNIQKTIIDLVKNQFNNDVEAARENAADKIDRQYKLRDSRSLIFPSDIDEDLIITNNFRRKKRIKARIQRKSPQYKRKK